MNKALRLKLRNAMMMDTEFLRSQGLMDYSMLIGIEKVGRESLANARV